MSESQHSSVCGQGGADRPASLEEGQQVFAKSIGVFSATAMVVGAIIGSGIFSTPAFVWQQVGSPGMSMIMWLLGGILTIFAVQCYSELGTMLPRSGGEQVYLSYIYTKPKELIAFLFCWVNVAGSRPAGSAANVIIFAKYLMYATFGPPKALSGGTLKNNYDWIMRGFGILGLLVVMTLSIVSTNWTLRLHNIITIIKVAVLLAIAIASVVVLAGGAQDIEQPGNWEGAFEGTSTGVSDYAFSLFKVLWTYSGWNNVILVLGELRNPSRNLPIATIGGVSIITTLYLLANAAYISVVPAAVAFSGREIIAASFVSTVFGPYVGRVVLPLLMSLSALDNVMIVLFAVSRLIFVMGQQRYLPALGFFMRVHSRFGTPYNGVIAFGCIIAIMMLAPPPGEAFDFLTTFSPYSRIFFFGLTTTGMLILRRREPLKERPFRVWWPLAVVYTTVVVFLAVIPFVPPENSTTSTIPYYLAPIMGIIYMLIGVPLWFIMVPHDGHIGEAWRSIVRFLGCKPTPLPQPAASNKQPDV
ncbi:amino acid/polyamine transporter I [Thamnocephalis sphaerospora]|uniref:Amino acid/polyamine transporter I n=1 Tax=Thamnocephalis sphaerospora TaxID=78915 RepID=A0A4P9XQ72_9FUNG|nr:amino acid/polyamine transporter I [Thamnocephalis sphaerospora]|eukprot:RKP08184.1 amino acid/polyamine transporter I [Thamnocephalis sphaerospora]